MEIRISLRKTVICLLVSGMLGGLCYWFTRPAPAPPPIPRHKAYIRANTPVEDYLPIPGAKIDFEINKTATAISHPGQEGWYDINYPEGGFAVYLSIVEVSPDKSENELGERLERMKRNLGTSKSVKQIPVESPDGFAGVLVTAPASCSTPVQLLMISPGKDMIVSATMFISDPRTSNDSELYLPQRDYIARDLLHAAKNLRR